MQNQTAIEILIIVGVLVMLSPAMVVVAFFNNYKKKLLLKEAKLLQIEHERQIENFKVANDAEEKEREKIARNIHDGIIPDLTAIQRSLEKYADNFSKQNIDIKGLENEIKRVSQTAENLRGISHDLIPTTLLKLGVIKALAYYVDRIREVGNSMADYENRTEWDEDLPFTMPQQLNIYRICLEILNNLYKHANYQYLKIIVERTGNNLQFEFTHNGMGITTKEIDKLAAGSQGLGLKSLMSRALLLNATINYEIDEGLASIKLQIPINGGK